MNRLIALVVIIVSSTATRGGAAEPVSLAAIEAACTQLCSPLARELTSGEAWLNKHEKDAFTTLAALIEDDDPEIQRRAVEAATILLSPWARGIKQGNTHKGQVELFQPRRPVTRPVDHSHAVVIRESALKSLNETLARATWLETKVAGSNLAAEDATNLWQFNESIRALCTCLAEVAEEQSTEDIVALLERESSHDRGAMIMSCLDTVYGLPVSFQVLGICGNSTPEEMKQFEASEKARYEVARRGLLTRYRELAGKSRVQRIATALDLWDQQLESSPYYMSESGDWATETTLSNLIRLGNDAVTDMQVRAAAVPAKHCWHAGAYHIAVAAITRKVDDEFVKRSLGGETFEQILACEIIAAAGDRRWKQELTELMKQPGGPYKKASHTLAVVHRTEAIPLLRQALSDDYMASCSIAELRAWGE